MRGYEFHIYIEQDDTTLKYSHTDIEWGNNRTEAEEKLTLLEGWHAIWFGRTIDPEKFDIKVTIQRAIDANSINGY